MKKIYFLFVFAIIAFTSNAQVGEDLKHRYTNAEIIKLTNYIKNLELKVAPYIAAHPDAKFVNIVENSSEEKLIVKQLVSDSMHQYNDAQVIKLARYVKHLETLDSLVTVDDNIAIARRKKTADSLAADLAIKNKVLEQYKNQILFDFDSSTLKPESYKVLDEAVAKLKSNNDLVFLIEGHTDNVGEDAYNLSLSKARAKSVMNYFVSKGIVASRITSEGYGESKPIAGNDTEAGRANNRRVEIIAKRK